MRFERDIADGRLPESFACVKCKAPLVTQRVDFDEATRCFVCPSCGCDMPLRDVAQAHLTVEERRAQFCHSCGVTIVQKIEREMGELDPKQKASATLWAALGCATAVGHALYGDDQGKQLEFVEFVQGFAPRYDIDAAWRKAEQIERGTT